MTERPPDAIARLDRAARVAIEMVETLTEGDLSRSTPCEGWTVRDLLNHVVSGNLATTAWIRGETPPDRSRDYLGSNAADALSSTLASVRAALEEPGAFERTVATPLGPLSGEAVARMRTTELLVHAWDLAVATGQPTDFEPELATELLEHWRTRPVPRGPAGPFGPEQPPANDATPTDRLAAFFGRHMPSSPGPPCDAPPPGGTPHAAFAKDRRPGALVAGLALDGAGCES